MSIDKNKPSFVLYPINNNRTGWKPVGFPVILVVPNRRDYGGSAIPNSNVFNVKILIEDTPRDSLVAGHDHVGLRYPDTELYAKYLTSLDLADSIIDLNAVTILRNGEPISVNEATTGDIIDYTTATGVHSQIDYLVGADYYDLSSFLIEVETLPSGHYNLSYQTEFYERVESKDDAKEFLCINPNSIQLSALKTPVQHPGIVLQEFYRLTPPPYLTNASKSQDSTISFYRPFADALEDVHDEQALLERINWLYDAPPQIIPYLSSLLGWDLPYYPQSLDRLRRAVLRRTVEFQNLKGSKRSITEIFKLFGFEILITSLWWSSDGKRLIRPDEKLPDPYKNEQIISEQNYQIDLCLNDIRLSTNVQYSIPLLYRPQIIGGLDEFSALKDGGSVTLDAYIVAYDTAETSAYNILTQLADLINSDPDNFGRETEINEDTAGFINPTYIHDALAGADVISYSQILISGGLGFASNEVQVGISPPLNKDNIQLDRETNNLFVTLNGYFDVKENNRLFLFATYKKADIVVPSVLSYMQSNKFDVQVITKSDQEYADPTTLEFAIEFLYRLKSFHSLLNSIKTRVELTETYEVTDLCVGGSYTQRYDTDIGRLQVPPAIIPNMPESINDCSKLDPESLGYKPQDLLLRKRKLANIPEEFEAWKALDDRETDNLDSSRIETPQPATGRESCKFTYRGQDRIIGNRTELKSFEYGPSPNANSSSNLDRLCPVNDVVAGDYTEQGANVTSNSSNSYGQFSREYTDFRQAFCSLDNITDYCYKGRVDDEVLHQAAQVNSEIIRSKPCSLGMGNGVYYAYPTVSLSVVAGTATPANRSKTTKTIYSGGASQAYQQHYSQGIQNSYLKISYNTISPKCDQSFLSRLYRSYDTPYGETIHYANREGDYQDQRQFLALQRPSLEVVKSTMHLPGCSFPYMYALYQDYDNATIKARPWDPQYSTLCGPRGICGNSEPTYLNCTLVTGSDGNETMVFDEFDYHIDGNGQIPDINSLGDHSIITGQQFDQFDVIHKIYSKDANANPAVTFQQLCDYDTSCVDGVLDITDPLFNSHDYCGTNNLQDFADGYACLSGYQSYNGEDLGQSGLYDDVLAELGLDLTSVTTGTQYLFMLNSGIRTGEEAYRLDCGCSIVECDATSESNLSTICSNSLYIDQDGEYDWDMAHIILQPYLELRESIGVQSIMCDGTIPTLLETL